MPKTVYPKIVIVGRTNVGKSSIFNRIAGSRKAIVESASGTTRDRLYAEIRWKGKAFTLVDTGGFDPHGVSDMASLIRRQLDNAINEADAIFFVTDNKVGVTAQDMDFSATLRKTSKKIFLIANKVDDGSKSAALTEFFELGLGAPYAVSATNGTGIKDLLDDVVKFIGKPSDAGSTPSVKVAIVGRPNVGKSSYLNSVLMEERVIVHPVAGTTRDAIDMDLRFKDRDYLLIDTAGIRHNARINESADFFGSVRSREAIKRADVALVVVDGFDGLREDDQRIIKLAIDESKAVVIAVNKWDLAKDADASRYRDMLVKKMNAVKNFPVVFISCKTRKNIFSSLDTIWSAYENFKSVIPPAGLSGILRSLNDAQEVKSKRMRFLFLVQSGTKPPCFTLGLKSHGRLRNDLVRYVENFIRKNHDFTGAPIKVEIKSKLASRVR